MSTLRNKTYRAYTTYGSTRLALALFAGALLMTPETTQAQVKGSALPVASSLSMADRVMMVTDPSGTPATKTATLTLIKSTLAAGSGDVVGPASAVNNRVAFFDGTTGKLLKDSGLTLSGNNTGDQDLSSYLTSSTAVSTYAPIANPTLTGTVTVPGTGLRISTGGGIGYFEFYNNLSNRLTVRVAALSGANTITVPNITGTLVTNADTATITSTMLAGSIDPSKITGTAAILGANTFTGLNKFTAGLESYWGNVTDNGAVLGLNAGITSVSSDPVAIGFNAVGGNVAPGASVIGIGRHAGYSAKGGNWIALGHAAGQYAHTADNAVLIGYLAGRNSSNQPSFSIWDSVMIGHNAGAQADSAAVSVMIGSEAGNNATSAIGSVMIGYAAGQNATTATNAVLIGRQAGSALTNAANRLVIDGNVDHSTGATGLLYGEFDNRLLTVNAATINLGTSGAAVKIGGGATAAELRLMEPSASGTNYTGFKAPALAGSVLYTLPTTDGSPGQSLTTNGSGSLSWASASGGGSGTVRKVTLVTKTDTASVTPGANTWATVWSFNYTPTQSNSIIVIRGLVSIGVSVSTPVRYKVLNGSTDLNLGDSAGSRSRVLGGVASNGSSPEYYGVYSGPVLVTDTPGTTSTQTYNLQLSSASGGATLYLNRDGIDADAAAFSRGASILEVVEIAP